MDSTAIRTRLDALIASRGEDYASLSRLLGRNASYVQQFIKRGVPRRLSESDRRILASHFGIAEHLLGGPTEEGRAILPRPGLARAAAPSSSPGHRDSRRRGLAAAAAERGAPGWRRAPRGAAQGATRARGGVR